MGNSKLHFDHNWISLEMESFDTIDPSTHSFKVPEKKILESDNLKEFQASDVYKYLLEFIIKLQASVKGTTMTATECPEWLKPLYDVLGRFISWVEEIPPEKQAMRFGNKAFRTWLDKVKKNYEEEIKNILGNEALHPAINELEVYLIDSFGSYERLDYGTGHELNFLAFLIWLYKIGVYSEENFQGLINKIFQRYLVLWRKIQTVYMLEPAGSHGVWGLDDYQHLAFIFGAGQLVGNDEWAPDIIHDDNVVEKHMKDYMYFGWIHFIKSVKKGAPFGESSPTLNDISAVPSWSKVAQGMVKMYQGEVLNKHPVIKHFKFGSLISFEPKNTFFRNA